VNAAAIVTLRQIYERTKNEAWEKPIETLGVIVVAIYTAFAGCQSCQMYHANNLTRQAIEASSRPYIEIAPIAISAEIQVQPVVNGPLEVPLSYPNIGKLPASAEITCVVEYSSLNRLTASDLSKGQTAHRILWPPPAAYTANAKTPRALTPDDIANLLAGKGWVYVRSRVIYTYGVKRGTEHRSEMCREYAVAASNNDGKGPLNVRLSNDQLCKDKDTNYAD
jgi:hypothetical protein